MVTYHPDTAAWGPKNENVPHAAREKWKTYRMRLRHVKKICDVKRVDQKKGRQTYRNRSELPPPLYTYAYYYMSCCTLLSVLLDITWV